MKPHKRNGRAAKLRRQEAAKDRLPKTTEEKRLIEVFGKKKEN